MVRILETLEALIVIKIIILGKMKLERKFRRGLMDSFFEKMIRKRDSPKSKLNSRSMD